MDMMLIKRIWVPKKLLPPNGEKIGSTPLEELKISIRKQGLLTPIHITESGELIEGYYRYRACQSLGIKEVPVKVVTSIKDVLEWKP